MAIAIRLSRGGAKKRPYYRIVVADARAPRDGKYLEQIGTYNPLLPKDSGERVKLNEDRARHWLGVGAQPSDRVARFLDAAGVRERAARSNLKKGEPGEKAKERAEERAAKEAEAAPLPLQVGPGPHEPGALVFQMREFDLQRAFPRTGALAEDLQDQAGPVDDLAFPRPLQVALLNRAELGIHDGHGDILGFDRLADRLDLALAHQCRRPPGSKRRDRGMHHHQPD